MKLPVELMQGKQKKLRALADRRGIIAAAAMDQRGSLRKAIAQARGVVEEKVTTQELGEFKAAVTKALTPHASAILLDPEWGMEATKQRAKGCGLLLAYEASGYDNTQPGRLPSFIPGQTVRKLVEAGADGIKVLLYYTPKESAQANAYKHDWIERVGAECALHGVPFFLELVSYDPSGGSTSTPEFAVQKPQLVIESITEFAKPQYLVDVFKAEIPVNLKFVTGSSLCKGTGVYSKPQALEAFRQLGKVVQGRPFIFLSAGVGASEFRESLELAGESGVAYNGVLCGRATWADGVPVYAKDGRVALDKWLSTQGVANIKALNDVLYRSAKPVPGLAA